MIFHLKAIFFSRTLMMACVSPTEIDSSETLSTVEYAARAKKIQNHVIVNKDYETTQILQLKARIVNLETELKLAREVYLRLILITLCLDSTRFSC
jgi:hypothetical protein